MRTIIKKEIDGLEIVVGFGWPNIDPVSSRPLVKAELEKSAEHKNLKAAQSQAKNEVEAQLLKVKKKRDALFVEHAGKGTEKNLKQTKEYQEFLKIKAGTDLKKEADIQRLGAVWVHVQNKKKSLMASKKNQIGKLLLQSDEYKNLQNLKVAQNEQVRAAHKKAGQKRAQILKQKAVYFTPRHGEDIISDEEVAPILEQFEALPPKTFLTTEGKEIKDQRRQQFFYQDESGLWQSLKVEKLGQELPEGAILKKEITPEIYAEISEQAQEKHIAELSDENRNNEFQERKKVVRRTAALMRSELEMDDVAPNQATKEAKAWYHEQVAALKEKYGQIDE